MKKSFQLILGIGVLLLFAASFNLAQGPYFVSLSGTGFVGETESKDYYYDNGSVRKTIAGPVYAQVVFPDYLKYIERMSITFRDSSTIAQISVRLYKKNRWTGSVGQVALCTTGYDTASTYVKTTSVVLGVGRGINNTHYSYYVEAFFQGPNVANLTLHSVTFKCQPH